MQVAQNPEGGFPCFDGWVMHVLAQECNIVRAFGMGEGSPEQRSHEGEIRFETHLSSLYVCLGGGDLHEGIDAAGVDWGGEGLRGG